MLISKELAKAFNEQIGHEFGASMQYVSIAAHFNQRQLTLLAKLFFKQAEEERQHAMKFVQYLLDTKGDLQIPGHPGAEADVHVGRGRGAGGAHLGEGGDQADHRADGHRGEAERLPRAELPAVVHRRAARGGRQDGPLLSVIEQSGERNLLMVEAYLVHIEKGA